VSLPRRRLVASLVLAGALAGCGHQQPSAQRTAVAAYLKRVQRVETRFTKPLATATQTGSKLAHGVSGGSGSFGKLALASTEGTLTAAIAQMQSLRAQLAAIPAPAATGHLRTLVLQLADRQIGLAREVGGLVTFLPQFNAAMRPLPAAIGRLQGVLRLSGSYTPAVLATVYAQKATALRRFKSAVAAIAADLARLHPPAVSAPGYRTQLASLRGMSTAAGRLAAALTAANAAAIRPQLIAFDRAATLNRTTGAQRAQIAAIRAFNADVNSLRTLATKIDVERYRLDTTLT
jgi:hypothetical protein